MRAALRAEVRKLKRGVWIAAGAALLVVASCARSGGDSPQWKAVGYFALLTNLSMMNAVAMPLTMAALASRLWDVETKGNGCRLLYTLQSRESLFAAKALLGMGQNLMLCAAECAGFVALGRLAGYTQALEPARVAWLFVSTFAVNAMLFFAALLLSVLSRTQALPLGAGLIASLTGVFTAFMPEALAGFVPWAYYLPMSALRMHYDREARIAQFEPLPWAMPAALLAMSLLLGALAFGLALRTVRNREV